MGQEHRKVSLWMDLPGGHRVGWRTYTGIWPVTMDERLLYSLGAQDVPTDQMAIVELPVEWEETPFILMVMEYGTLECQLFAWDIDWWVPAFYGEFLVHLPTLEESPDVKRLIFRKAERR